jgi:hypothetical protein
LDRSFVRDQLRQDLDNFVGADTFARRLMTIKGMAPYEGVRKNGTTERDRLISDLAHQSPGPDI